MVVDRLILRRKLPYEKMISVCFETFHVRDLLRDLMAKNVPGCKISWSDLKHSSFLLFW